MQSFKNITRAVNKVLYSTIYDPFSLLMLIRLYRKQNTRYMLWHRNNGFGHQLVELPYAISLFSEKPDFNYVIISYGNGANEFLFKSLITTSVIEVKIYSYYIHYVVSSVIQKKLHEQTVNISIAPNDEVYEYCKANKLMHEYSLIEARQYMKVISGIERNYNWSYSTENMFSAEDKKACIKLLEDININSNDWFVCLHIRVNKHWSFERNNKIKIYNKSIDYINSIGGHVIIIGDYKKNHNGCSSFYNNYGSDEVLMMYILKHQKFMIGTSSGPSNVSVMFDVPVISTNVTQWDAVAYGEKSSYLPKMIRNKNTNALLTASEVMELRRKESFYLDGLPDSVEYLDNEEDSILSAVIKKNSEIDNNIFSSKIDQSIFKNNFGDGKILWAVKSKIDDSYYDKYRYIFEG